MPVITLITATLLIFLGTVGYANGTPNAEGVVSPTAFIPAAVGGLLALCGALGFVAGLRKHAMHGAAMVGLLGALGGFMPLIRQAGKPGGIDPTKPAAMTGLLMVGICAVFVALCVKSFIDARKARTTAVLSEPEA